MTLYLMSCIQPLECNPAEIHPVLGQEAAVGINRKTVAYQFWESRCSSVQNENLHVNTHIREGVFLTQCVCLSLLISETIFLSLYKTFSGNLCNEIMKKQ